MPDCCHRKLVCGPLWTVRATQKDVTEGGPRCVVGSCAPRNGFMRTWISLGIRRWRGSVGTEYVVDEAAHG